MFNKIFASIFTVFFIALANLQAASPIFYNVKKKEYAFSTIFELSSQTSKFGTVVKSALNVRCSYDLYDTKGRHQATAISRILTLGLFYDWGTELDIYNPAGNHIGVIDGQAVTGAAAKFSFYDARGNHVGIAYLDHNCMGFSIVDPYNEYNVIAQFTRCFVDNAVDTWDISIYDPDAIPEEHLFFFSAFAADRQNAFREDT